MTGVYENTTVAYSKLNKPRKRRCNCKVALITTTLCVFTATGLFLAIGSVFFPLHASCKVDWTFGKSCSDVQADLVKQITAWESADNCKDGGEKCLYKLVNRTESVLLATHETPKKRYIDDMTFNFKDDDSICNVHGYSTSRTWYAVLDMGTNYCNLHNLIVGASLDQTANYTESTCGSQCTQYGSADCEVY